MIALRPWLEQQGALDRVEEALMNAGLAHAISWPEVDRLLAGLRRNRDSKSDAELYADWLIECFRLRFTPAQLESMPAALALGARPEELLILQVHGFSAEGQDLGIVDDAEWKRRSQAVIGLRDSFGGSRWLDGYAVRLGEEWQRRHGRGA